MGRERNPNSPTHHKSRKSITLKGDEIFSLPDEIITEIILRLPVKSIVKFRSVSKSWLSLIFSQRFIKTHLNFSRNDPNANGHRVILTVRCPQLGLKQCSIGSLMREQTLADAFIMDSPIQHPHRAVWVVGCCNGLICIVIGSKNLFLWNPSIKKSMKLPSMDITMDTPYYSVFGFGFDESNDDYKVVRIFCLFGDDGRFESIVNIYSFKTDSWKRIEDFKGGSPLDDYGIFTNGKLHWSATTSRVCSNLQWDIVSLDLETELYGMVEQPNYLEGEFDAKLGVLEGCICVLCNYGNTRVDLWVLKEYGVKGSWSKVFTLENRGNLFNPKPACMLATGETVLAFRNFFIICNRRSKSIRIIQTNNLDRILRSDFYVESLVSPVANGRLQSESTSVMNEKVVDEDRA